MASLENRTHTVEFTSGMVKGKFHAIDVATTQAVLAMEIRTDCIIDRWVIGNDTGGYRVTIEHNTPTDYGTVVMGDGIGDSELRANRRMP